MTGKDDKKAETHCPHCGSKYVITTYIEWRGENPDGSDAPQQWTWECLNCGKSFTTIE